MPLRRKSKIPLLSYQQRWLDDDSRFKIACKARQIGFTFAATLRVLLKRRTQKGLTLWISASDRQALEAMEYIRLHARVLGLFLRNREEFIEGTSVKQRVVRMPNGSRIVALPANPDTVRGFAGDVVLDEFAFHRDAEAIWRAAFATATRGYQIEVISTPNGTRGKYYELAKAAGLVDGPWAAASYELPVTSHSIFSPHWVDLAAARAQGFRVDVEALRAAIGDQDAWEQEYCCRFLSDAAHFLPPELVVAAESPTASVSTGESRLEAGATNYYLGVDIGRKRDLTVLWLLEAENAEAPAEARTYVTRGVRTLDRQPFAQQRAVLDGLLAQRGETSEIRKEKIEKSSAFHFPVSSFALLVRRCAVDASGLGAMLAEELTAKWGARVEPVVFTAAVKEAMAVRVKRLLEERRLKIPYDPAIRAALGAVKRLVTAAGNVRFDAERTEASGHADHFWALALALHAGEEPGLSVEYVSSRAPCAHALSTAF